MLLQPLTSFERQKYYQNELKFNGAYSNDNLPKRRDGSYVTNFDELRLTEFHWIALFVNGDNVDILDKFTV